MESKFHHPQQCAVPVVVEQFLSSFCLLALLVLFSTSKTNQGQSKAFHGQSTTFHGQWATFHGQSATFHGQSATFHGQWATFTVNQPHFTDIRPQVMVISWTTIHGRPEDLMDTRINQMPSFFKQIAQQFFWKLVSLICFDSSGVP